MYALRVGILGVFGLIGLGCSVASSDEGPIIEDLPSAPPEAEAQAQIAGPSIHPEPNAPRPIPAPAPAVAEPTAEKAPFGSEEVVPEALTTDFCDEPVYGTTSWSETTRGKLKLRYVPGTAAEKDLEKIATVRNELYGKISTALGVADPGTISITFSPNRATAKANGLQKGVAYPASNKIEVLWLGDPDSYEAAAPGHELTHIISAKIDGVTNHLGVLSEGLAEYFDGSGRDLHEAYARDLRASIDASFTTRFSDSDLWGYNYGRAGSFVKFLVDRSGMEKFVALWKANALTWSSGAYVTKLGVVVKDGFGVEAALDKSLREVYGVGFEALRFEWAAVLAPYLTAKPSTLPSWDVAAIENVLDNVDWADTHGSAAVLRSTMDGFYCDTTTDESRAKLASAAVEGRGTLRTQTTALYPIGMRNYPQALAFTVRREQRGTSMIDVTSRVWLEKFPVGWRITFADRW
ncbi:MAG: hypothetical protein HYV09_35465 [Deltaproteobacteria bacterium]|nr:hypothetical protein [Deltaproteobacteria bacterium]